MLDEDLDMGLFAEDVYAAYVIQIATELQITPDFRNARGATVDLVFAGPFMTEAAFQEAVAALRTGDSKGGVSFINGDVATTSNNSTNQNLPLWERLAHASLKGTETVVVVLHAWIEKLNGPRKMQLTETVQPVHEEQLACSDFASARMTTDAEANANMENPDRDSVNGSEYDVKEGQKRVITYRRVLGSLDFLFHLSTRSLLGESNASQDVSSMDGFDSSPSSPLTGPAAEACAIRDALEQGDGIALARNAVDTVIKFAQLAEKHAGEVATVFIDEAHGEEYLQFGS